MKQKTGQREGNCIDRERNLNNYLVHLSLLKETIQNKNTFVGFPVKQHHSHLKSHFIILSCKFAPEETVYNWQTALGYDLLQLHSFGLCLRNVFMTYTDDIRAESVPHLAGDCPMAFALRIARGRGWLYTISSKFKCCYTRIAIRVHRFTMALWIEHTNW